MKLIAAIIFLFGCILLAAPKMGTSHRSGYQVIHLNKQEQALAQSMQKDSSCIILWAMVEDEELIIFWGRK